MSQQRNRKQHIIPCFEVRSVSPCKNSQKLPDQVHIFLSVILLCNSAPFSARTAGPCTVLSLGHQQRIRAEHPPRLGQSPLQWPSVADTTSLLLLHCSVHPTPDMTTTLLTPVTAVYVDSPQHCSMLQCLKHPMPCQYPESCHYTHR